MTSLDLALIGNGTVGALVDSLSSIVWACMPRFDSDPAFCSLLQTQNQQHDFGFYSVELLDRVKD